MSGMPALQGSDATTPLWLRIPVAGLAALFLVPPLVLFAGFLLIATAPLAIAALPFIIYGLEGDPEGKGPVSRASIRPAPALVPRYT